MEFPIMSCNCANTAQSGIYLTLPSPIPQKRHQLQNPLKTKHSHVTNPSH